MRTSNASSIIYDENMVIPENFKEVKLLVDMNKADKRAANYGHITAPVVVVNRFGKFDSNSKFKIWLQNNKYKKLLTSTFNPVFHEEVLEQLNSIIDSKLPLIQELDFKIKDTYEANNGDTKYWTLLSNQKYDVDGNGDMVQLGVIIRNGIGTQVSLGVDLYTYRLICSNGAIARGREVGAFSYSHALQYNTITELFGESIVNTFGKIRDFVTNYKKAHQIEVNEPIANRMFKKLWDLGDTYLPDSWDIPKPKELQEMRKKGKFAESNNLVKINKKQSLWEVFNDITEHHKERLDAKKITMPTVAFQQDKLHRELIAIVNERKL